MEAMEAVLAIEGYNHRDFSLSAFVPGPPSFHCLHKEQQILMKITANGRHGSYGGISG